MRIELSNSGWPADRASRDRSLGRPWWRLEFAWRGWCPRPEKVSAAV